MEIRRRHPPDAHKFRSGDCTAETSQCTCNTANHFLLNKENPFLNATIAACPNMLTGLAFNQLRCYVHLLAIGLNASFKQIVGPE
jgi:hypothetical protein